MFDFARVLGSDINWGWRTEDGGGRVRLDGYVCSVIFFFFGGEGELIFVYVCVVEARRSEGARR